MEDTTTTGAAESRNSQNESRSKSSIRTSLLGFLDTFSDPTNEARRLRSEEAVECKCVFDFAITCGRLVAQDTMIAMFISIALIVVHGQLAETGH